MVEIKEKRWMITLWDFNVVNNLRNKIHLLDYIAIGKEICPTTQSLHFHAYLETKKAYSLSSIKSILKCKTAHVEIARLSRDACVHYCLKDGECFFQYCNDKSEEEEEDIFDIFNIDPKKRKAPASTSKM